MGVRDPEVRRRDRSLAVALLGCLLLGLLSLAYGMWGLSAPDPPGFRGNPIVGLFFGPLLIGTFVVQLVKRLWNGPEQPGRHARRTHH